MKVTYLVSQGRTVQGGDTFMLSCLSTIDAKEIEAILILLQKCLG